MFFDVCQFLFDLFLLFLLIFFAFALLGVNRPGGCQYNKDTINGQLYSAGMVRVTLTTISQPSATTRRYASNIFCANTTPFERS